MYSSKYKSKILQREKGITLIALVVTIVVLLILAGVSISMLSGDDGIINQAQKASKKTSEAENIEKIRLAISEAQMGEEYYQKLNETNFKEELENQFKGKNVQLIDNRDGNFTINLDNGSKVYYVDTDGQIIGSENILKISTVDELKVFRENVNSGNSYEGCYVYLSNDITLNENEQWKPIGIYVNEATSPEDSRNKYFSGVFDGKNHYIKGVNINTTNKVQGLFGLNQGGTIKNLQVLDCNIIGGIATGGVVGYNYKNAKIYNCSVSGVITCVGTQMAGGISGNNIEKSIIEKCFNLSSISGTALIGGITGYQTNGSTINSCFNEGIIKCGNVQAGGIVGRMDSKDTIKNCYNKGNVIGGTFSIGGILGANTNGLVKNSYNLANVTCSDKSGVGYIAGRNYSGGNIYNCCFLQIDETINGVGHTDNSSNTNIEVINNELLSIINEENEFKQDTNNINNGYPILNWQ